jgi:hypothetical protein
MRSPLSVQTLLRRFRSFQIIISVGLKEALELRVQLSQPHLNGCT